MSGGAVTLDAPPEPDCTVPLIDSTDAELDAFDRVFERLGGFSERVSDEWADGYLTALAAGQQPTRLHVGSGADGWELALT